MNRVSDLLRQPHSLLPIFHVSYFPSCCEKIANGSNSRGKRLTAAHTLRRDLVHPAEKTPRWDQEAACRTSLTDIERGMKLELGFLFSLPVCLVQDAPSHEMVHLMLKVSFLLDSFSQISTEASPSYF